MAGLGGLPCVAAAYAYELGNEEALWFEVMGQRRASLQTQVRIPGIKDKDVLISNVLSHRLIGSLITGFIYDEAA